MTELAHAVAAQRFAPGSLVTARGREWVVLPDSEPDMLVLRPLGGADGDVAAVFPDLEPVAQASFPPPDADDLGDAQAAGLLRTALRIGFRSSAGPFRSLAAIAVEPRPYQLVPLLMAMRQDTVRLAICDDVGIGKTVESGLIAAELRAQGEAKGLAVLCPPALAEQWQDELRTKFGINAELILASTVPRLERALAYGESLFSTHQTVVISTDFIKSPRHRDDFIDHCPDLVIVDEAHTCVPADGAGTSSGSAQLRYELLTRLARDDRRHLLLVTATPHSGKDESFRTLIGLLNPDLAAADLTSDAGRTRLASYYVQRRRLDIRRQYPDEAGAFPGDRIFGDVPYTLSPGYRALLDDAIAYASERVTVAGTVGRREQRVAWWSAIALLRSLVSSPRAAAQTLLTRSQTAAAATADEADALGRPVTADMADDSFDGIDASPGADDGGTASTASAAARPRDARLAALAERATALEGPEQDKKLALLIKTVKQLLADGYHPIVFCRYIPTSEYLAGQLDGKLGRKTVVACVNGTLSPAQRLDRIERLAEAAGQEDGARRVLVATDCLSEGVNLQHHFNAVVHYDLAWNPTRHEQREGRVDRFGQRSDRRPRRHHLRRRQRHRRQGPRSAHPQAPRDPQAHRHLRAHPRRDLQPGHRRDHGMAAHARPGQRRPAGALRARRGHRQDGRGTGRPVALDGRPRGPVQVPVRPGVHPPRRGRGRGRRDPRRPRPRRRGPRLRQDRAEGPERRPHHRARRRRVHRHHQHPPAWAAGRDRRADRRAAAASPSRPPPPCRAARHRSPVPIRWSARSPATSWRTPSTGTRLLASSPPAAAASSAPPLSPPGPRCCSSATATSSPSPAGTETRR